MFASFKSTVCKPRFSNVTAVSTCGPRPFLCRHRRAGVLKPIQAFKADTSVDALNAVQQQPKKAERTKAKLPMLSLISSAVAIQAQTQRFETLAGRSAMIGVLVALVAELLTERSIFRHFSPESVASLSGLFMGALSLAAAAAFASKRRMGVELLEAVVTSLTANQRSAASITERQVDTAVDSVLNKAFDQGVIYSILAEDEDI